jgi:hypothetical protein
VLAMRDWMPSTRRRTHSSNAPRPCRSRVRAPASSTAAPSARSRQ